MPLPNFSKANQGKGAESEAMAWLETLAKKVSVQFWRMPDAKAGSLKKAPADFLISVAGIGCVLLDVKEVKHDFRLPKKNFSQYPTFVMWEAAGTPTALLVKHSTTGLWRLVPMSDILAQGDVASWDLSLHTEYRDLSLITLDLFKEIISCQR